ncbi:hypothetical protein TVAG_271770 [Trichomonas vaginalis G3]|uniref:Uncharacterized protein n=1 Tax=Trichomonas vaginalis (strain ATCC PRA-98 / G3) TaxID=412133 RepID=A2E5S4_TRIV3|nr:regulation of choline O-acetyltransferase protein [Trichomonas vaginalis G3]EAY11994.1 hypothetical protein TVAG_271770 [Trichomonas vaginalis G3]KAI5524831.1 regulation of choline O-acetyltransferase protein [Trichomonas vaginalis G3]|eukprot:XP_001324217.1 hypothetical protein [Trichomonas vaginalis G3]
MKINEETTTTCNKQNAGKESSYKLKVIDEQGNQVVLDRHFICPDPERFCRTMKLSSMYFDKDPLDPNTKVLEGEPQEKPEWNFDYSDLYNETEPTKQPSKNNNKLKPGYIVLIVIGSLVVIGAVFAVIFILFKKKSNIPESVENDLNDINETNENE